MNVHSTTPPFTLARKMFLLRVTRMSSGVSKWRAYLRTEPTLNQFVRVWEIFLVFLWLFCLFFKNVATRVFMYARIRLIESLYASTLRSHESALVKVIAQWEIDWLWVEGSKGHVLDVLSEIEYANDTMSFISWKYHLHTLFEYASEYANALFHELIDEVILNCLWVLLFWRPDPYMLFNHQSHYFVGTTLKWNAMDFVKADILSYLGFNHCTW